MMANGEQELFDVDVYLVNVYCTCCMHTELLILMSSFWHVRERYSLKMWFAVSNGKCPHWNWTDRNNLLLSCE